MKKHLALLFLGQRHRSTKVNPRVTPEALTAPTSASLILPGELLRLAEAGKYLELQEKINTQGGLYYRRLPDTTENGDTLVHLIARNYPQPFSLAGDLVAAINFFTNSTFVSTAELFHKPNQAGETFFTITQTRGCDMYKELAPERILNLEFFKKAASHTSTVPTEQKTPNP